MRMQAFFPLAAGANLSNAIVFATSTAAASKQFRTTGIGGTSVAAQGATMPDGILICNAGPDWLWFNLGQLATLTAAAIPVATSIPLCGVPPNSQSTFICDPSVQWISAILSSGTGTCVLVLGEGM